MMALTNQNKVYSWGNGKGGVLGHGDESGTDTPTLIKDLSKDIIIYIANGQYNSAAVNIQGKLFIWGQGSYGRLGLGDDLSYFSPQHLNEKVLEKEKIFMISLGPYHTLCSSSNANT